MMCLPACLGAETRIGTEFCCTVVHACPALSASLMQACFQQACSLVYVMCMPEYQTILEPEHCRTAVLRPDVPLYVSCSWLRLLLLSERECLRAINCCILLGSALCALLVAQLRTQICL